VKIKKGDTVKILSGKDRGKTGRVSMVLKKENKILVEKINIVKKHRKQKSDQKEEQGIIEVEAPISASKAMIVCPLCNKPTRVSYKVSKGKKERMCKKCGKFI
jgi:large subunit ribosomal protein L24